MSGAIFADAPTERLSCPTKLRTSEVGKLFWNSHQQNEGLGLARFRVVLERLKVPRNVGEKFIDLIALVDQALGVHAVDSQFQVPAVRG
jgi:hypothetical protein